MVDPKIMTLLTLANIGNYTKTAKVLSLTQPAVSQHIKLLEEEFGIKIFYRSQRQLKPTSEGEILIKYARRIQALSSNARQAIADSKKSIGRITIGITTTLSDYIVPQVFSPYIQENPGVHINIVTDNIKNIYNMLQSYELDCAIIEGNILNENYTSILLDTDYLCLIVSPEHKFAKRDSVNLHELKKEKFILRSPNTGTRSLFENHLLRHSEHIRNFNIIIQIDNVTAIKELVASNLGVTIIAHSAIKDEEASGKLIVVPVINLNMTREINMIYHHDFEHAQVLEDVRRIYNIGN